MQFPGWTNAWTMPIKTRVDMLTTGVRTPIGIKVFGTDLNEVEKVGVSLEHLLAPIKGTRSVLYERNLGGLYLDIIPKPDELARYGLRVADVERVIESAIGGAPIGTTIEGRNRFSINVRYPQDLRSDLESLRQVLVPIGASAPAGGMPMGTQGAPETTQQTPPGSGSNRQSSSRSARSPTSRSPAARPWCATRRACWSATSTSTSTRPSATSAATSTEAKDVVAKAIASGELKLPSGYFLKWTGQYEQLAEMLARMKIVIPVTLVIIVLLLFLQFRNVVEVLIILLSIPFALIGSVWLMWLLDYRLSTAVWVGIIALVGLAAQTGIVMIVYIDHAFQRRKEAGLIRNLDDIVAAHMEGTVQRVRPKLMTVSTMLIGLVPLLWATSSGADVMKRIAAPMVGGLLTSAFLTLEIIPVIVTYWRLEQLLWERLTSLGAATCCGG